jgi:hypothetical protein
MWALVNQDSYFCSMCCNPSMGHRKIWRNLTINEKTQLAVLCQLITIISQQTTVFTVTWQLRVVTLIACMYCNLLVHDVEQRRPHYCYVVDWCEGGGTVKQNAMVTPTDLVCASNWRWRILNRSTATSSANARGRWVCFFPPTIHLHENL